MSQPACCRITRNGVPLGSPPCRMATAFQSLRSNWPMRTPQSWSFGLSRPISFLRVDSPPTGQRVINAAVSQQLIGMLESVVVAEGATGKRAAIPGYRVSGKTGTAWKAFAGGYSTDRFMAVFGGVAPATEPRLAAVVVIDEPSAGLHRGGDVSAPVFSAVVGGALRLLAVAPDRSVNAPDDVVPAPDAGRCSNGGAAMTPTLHKRLHAPAGEDGRVAGAPVLGPRRLADLTAGLVTVPPELIVSDVTLDSRAASPRSLFLACSGRTKPWTEIRATSRRTRRERCAVRRHSRRRVDKARFWIRHFCSRRSTVEPTRRNNR